MKAAVAALVAAAALPLFMSAGGTLMDHLVVAAIYVVMALGLNVVVGFAGLLDLGYVAFFLIGAYAAAHFGSAFWGLHLDFLVILAIAVVATTAAGVLIGVPTLRLRGDYIAVVTLAFGEIIGQVAENGREIRFLGGSLTGGVYGMSGIDRIDLPFLARFSALDLRPWYWSALALVAVVLFVNVRLRASRTGRAWVAVREDEDAAASAGIPVARTKLRAYGVGAALGGVAGAFMASYLGTVDPSQATFSFSIFILAMVVLGGLGSVWGVVLGALVLSGINSWLLPRVLADLPATIGLDFDVSQVSSGIYGFLLVLLMLLRPQGLLPESALAAARRRAGGRAPRWPRRRGRAAVRAPVP